MKIYETCIRCGRKLTNQASKELGFGKVCREKWLHENNLVPLFSTNFEESDVVDKSKWGVQHDKI